MTKTTRRMMVGVATVGFLTVGPPVVAAAAESPKSHVRSQNPAIVALINQGTEQSKTFRGIVAKINAHDGLVYVKEGTCGHGVRACLVAVTLAGSRRILWVKVDMRQTDAELIKSIGHELRHTIEVLESSWVTNNTAMYLFYRQVGSYGTGSVFETVAAVDTGNAVGSEIGKYRAGANVR